MDGKGKGWNIAENERKTFLQTTDSNTLKHHNYHKDKICQKCVQDVDLSFKFLLDFICSFVTLVLKYCRDLAEWGKKGIR